MLNKDSETLAKLAVIESACLVLEKVGQAEKVLPTVLWVREEAAKLTSDMLRPSRFRKINKIRDRKALDATAAIKHLRTMIGEGRGSSEDGDTGTGNLYLASTITHLLADMLEDGHKADRIEPILDGSYAIEDMIKERANCNAVRHEASLFVEEIYSKLLEMKR